MENDKSTGGAGTGNDGGADPNDQQKPDPKPRVVAWEDHKRALDDLHKFKKQVSELETKFSQIEDQRLRDQNDWKQLAEKEKKRADDADAKVKTITGSLVLTQKHQAVQKAALDAGIRQEALADLDLLDLNEVQVEATSTGRYIVSGANEYIDELKAKKPHWFKTAKAPNLNTGGGGAPRDTKSGEITAEKIVQLERGVKAGTVRRETYLAAVETYAKARKLKQA